jgi:hypothetical protein
MQQPIDRSAELIVQRLQCHVCLAVEGNGRDGRRLLERAMGFAVVSCLWGLVLIGFLQGWS